MSAPTANFLRRFAEVSAQVASMPPSRQKSELKAKLDTLRTSADKAAKTKPKVSKK